MAEGALKILAVDDNVDALYVLEQTLLHHGFSVVTASSGAAAVEAVAREHPDIVLLDINMPGMDGYEATRRIRADTSVSSPAIILLTAINTLDGVSRGLDLGAVDYMTKPFKTEELVLRLLVVGRRILVEREVSELRSQVRAQRNFGNIIGKSRPMQEVFTLLDKVKDASVPVLILGESGTGKELIARAIHYNSPRKERSFVVQNCSAFNDNLLESELFGHVKGAFTGAVRDKEGLFSVADHGTFFLDELGEMSAALQVKLLRVLQQGTFMPVGGTKERKVDVRLITATNRSLADMVADGSFREDLFYRLNLLTIKLPPLRDRREDIPLLADHFLARFEGERRERRRISAETMRLLTDYPWPGNIRELENEVERCVLMAGDAEVIAPDHLSVHVREGGRVGRKAVAPSGSLKEAVEALERTMIADALERTGGNKSEAARELGIARSNLIAKAQSYGIAESSKKPR